MSDDHDDDGDGSTSRSHRTTDSVIVIVIVHVCDGIVAVVVVGVQVVVGRTHAEVGLYSRSAVVVVVAPVVIVDYDGRDNDGCDDDGMIIGANDHGCYRYCCFAGILKPTLFTNFVISQI